MAGRKERLFRLAVPGGFRKKAYKGPGIMPGSPVSASSRTAALYILNNEISIVLL
jgi:hypothetical protein